MPHLLPALPDRLAAAYRRLGVRGRVVLAVSGGADSMALLRGTLAIADAVGLEPVVAHFDHGLREKSGEEVAWLGEQVGALGTVESGAPLRGGRSASERRTTFIAERGEVRAAAAESGQGIEETARRLRYEFLVRTAQQFEAPFVVTAHTADDQAETVLFHMLRGTGLRGLRGIPPRRRLSENVTLVRPMLDVTRAEVEAYLASIGQEFLTDPSNADSAFTRNRLRHELMPLLRETINPRLDEALLRLSSQADEASRLMLRLARNVLRPSVVELTPDVIRIRCRHLKNCPRPVLREAIALAWRRAGWPRQGMGYAHWNAIAEIAVSGGRRTLPGGTDVRRRQGELILRRGAS